MKTRVQLLLLCILLFTNLSWPADKLTPEQLVAKHLDSIGPADYRSQKKAIALFGTNEFRGLSTAHGYLEGHAKLVSEGMRYQFLSDFKSPDYEGEAIGWNGDRSEIANLGQERFSYLASFFHRHPYFIRDGLFGGTLNRAWALGEVNNHSPRLRSDGLKRYNGRQLLQLTYDPKKSEANLIVKLYFEPDTFRHVATVYVMDEIPQLEERFSDFKTVNGLTLPHQWDIYYTQPLESLVLRWNIRVTEIKVLDALPR